jgi:hypothetical protein
LKDFGFFRGFFFLKIKRTSHVLILVPVPPKNGNPDLVLAKK